MPATLHSPLPFSTPHSRLFFLVPLAIQSAASHVSTSSAALKLRNFTSAVGSNKSVGTPAPAPAPTPTTPQKQITSSTQRMTNTSEQTMELRNASPEPGARAGAGAGGGGSSGDMLSTDAAPG